MNRLAATFVLGVFLAGLTPASLWAEPEKSPILPVPAPAASPPAPETAPAPAGQTVRVIPAAEAETAPQIVLAKAETTVTPENGGTLTLGTMSVELPPGAVDRPMTVSVEELGSVQTMNPGLQNATARVAGYRLLPHRTFAGWVKLSLPYDQTLADTPAARDALEAYFYDEDARVWTKIRKTGVDEKRGVVEGVTSHFTDFITGTLKLPDSPKPLGFNPTSIKDIKAADPGAGVPQIKGLEAGNTGSANFQIPMRLPAGRAGLTPELALSYDSGIKSGWLGVGFDVNIPALRIDTRFNVPNYDGNDLYSLGGQDLTKVSDTGTVAVFVPRVEGAFSRITRLPGSGHQYQWVVAEKDGRVSYYGGTADSTGGPTTGHDYVWYLNRQEDPNGNWLQWTYTTDDGHIYPATIIYTGHGSDSGAYKVVFENDTRPDRRGDARGGYLDKLDQRLKDVQVYYIGGSAPALIRKNVFEYGTTTFGKSILTGYHEEDGSGTVFYRYSFDHYSLPTDPTTGKVFALSDPKPWDGGTQKGDFDSSFNTDSSGGANFYAGLKVIPGGSFSAGINATFGNSSSYENSKLLNLKGDGVPDLVTHNMKSQGIAGGIYGGGFSGLTIGGDTSFWDLLNSSTSSNNRTDVGYFASIGGFGASVSGSYAKSWDASTTNWTFIDIDGDGLIDIVGPEDYYYKNTSSGGKVSFVKTVYGSSGTATSTPALDPEIAQRYHLLDPVRLWAAWRDGTVDVGSNVGVSGSQTGWDGVVSSLYVNGTKNQSVALTADGTKSLSLTGQSVTQGDRVSFRLNANYYVAGDTVGWGQTVRYKTIRLFSDKTNTPYIVYPSQLPDPLPSGTVTVGDWRTGVHTYNIGSILNAAYTAQHDGDTGVVTGWTLSGSQSASLGVVLEALGYCVYQKLKVSDYTIYGRKAELDSDGIPVLDNNGNPIVGNGLSAYYTYNPVSGVMELSSTAAASSSTLASIQSLMQSNGFHGYTANQTFTTGVSGTLDPATGKTISSQNYPVTIGSGSALGQWDAANKRFWAETDTDISGGSTRVWLGPYQDSSQTWHVAVHTEGSKLFDGTDVWYDGSAITLTPLTRATDGLTYVKIAIGAAGQSHEIDAFYTLPPQLDRPTVYSLWGTQTVTSIQASAMTTAVGVLGPTEGSWFQGQFTPVVSQYTPSSGLSSDETNFVTVCESLTSVTPSSGAISAAQLAAVQSALGTAAAQSLQSSYSLSGSTWTLGSSLSSAQKSFVLIAEEIGSVASGSTPAATLDAATMTTLLAAVTAGAATHFTADFTPQTASYALISGASEEVFWDEGLAHLLPDFGMTANQASGAWITEATPPASLAQTIAAANLFTYTQAVDWLDFDSQTVFPVTTVAAPSAINEYQWGSRTTTGTSDAVVVGVFDASGNVVATPVYVHAFDTTTDTNSTDVFSQSPLADTTTTVALAANNVLQTFAGGGYSWYYAEWDGSQEYSESLIQNQLNVTQDQSSSNDSRLNSQVIWKMHWGETGTPYAGVWHGAVTTQQTTNWDASSQSIQTTTTYGYSAIGAAQSQPYRVGGDSAIQTAATSDLASGGGLSWVRQSSGTNTTYSVGGGFASVGGNITYSTGNTSGTYDLMDVNGDGLPDLIKSNGTVYLNTGNGFSSTGIKWGNSSLRNFTNVGLSLSGSGSASSEAMAQIVNPGGKVAAVYPAPGTNSSASASIGAGYSIGASYKTNDLIDILGDGLPDMVSSSGSNLNVTLNTGHGFGPTTLSFAVPSTVQSYLDSEVQSRFKSAGIGGSALQAMALSSASSRTSLLGFSGSTTSSANVSVGGGSSSNSFSTIYDSINGLQSLSGSGVGVTGSIGINISGSTSRSYYDLIDVDGDGLPDMVFKDVANNRLMVAFNLGDTFAAPVPWGSPSSVNVDLRSAGQFYNPMTGGMQSASTLDDKTPSGAESPWTLDEEINSSTTINWNLNGSIGFEFDFYFWIPLFGPVLDPFFGFGFSLSGGSGTTSIESGLQDVEGIGMPDAVMNLGGTMVVRQNLSGQDGLLTKITTPQGGEIDLTFSRTANTTDDPHSRWVLSHIVSTNWNQTAVAGTDAAALPVQTIASNFTYSGGYYDRTDRRFWGFTQVTTTRADGQSKVVTYANKDYYLHSKVLKTVLYDAQGNVLERETNTLNTSAIVTAAGAKPSNWVCVTDTLHETLDPSGTGTLTIDTRYSSYDAYGNPTEVDEYQNGNLRNRVKITYQLPSGSLYLAWLPLTLEVDDASGAVLRQRTGSYDSLGNLTRQDSQYSSGSSLSTTLTWDSYGNLASESDNAGYELDYTYDPVLHALVTNVQDTLNQTTSWTYDYSQGLELSQTDTNSQVITKTYDTFGRMTAVRSPYDTGSVPALSFSYDQTSYPWKAVTQNKVNYDPSDSQTIATVVMADGQGRMLQTKKQSVVTDPSSGTGTLGWIISPWVVYDAEGRESQKGTPTFESDSSHTGVYMTPVRTAFATGDLYTQTTYDSRDRTIDTRLPDGAHQSTSYVLDQWNQQTAWNITSTDPVGRQKRVFKDPDDLIVAVVQDPAGKALTSKFTYDGIGQLLTAADPNGNTTSVVYDQLGRKTSLNSPDAGLTAWEYDTNGDLTRKTDPVLRSKNLSITYSYTQHRISQITYPDSTQTYAYGTDASQFNVGRVISVANDRVTTNTAYGKLGETTGTTRTIKTRLAGNPDYVMTLAYAWNYLGQMTDVTYPDGEALHYGYDAGGQVTTIAGTHLSASFAYVNAIGYDEYGQRVRMDLGNGAKTVYTYDPARRWLKEALTTDSANTVLQDLNYTFDTSGDVTTLNNGSSKKTTVQNYSYDALDQLTAANGTYQNNTFSLASSTKYSQSFAYDAIGNLTTKTSTLNRTPATSQDGLLNYSLGYTYDATHPHQATHIGTDHYVYDVNGNLTKIIPDWAWTGQNTDPKTVIVTTTSTGRDVLNQAIGENRSTSVTTTQSGSRYLTWDWENRLRTYKDDQNTVTYDYDADGERRLKTLGTAETVYADRMYEVQNASARELATVNVYLGDTRLVSKVVPLNSPSTDYEHQNTYYYHADHIGNSTLITDYQGNEFERLAFTPHGELWQDDTLDTLDKIDFLFTGKQMDAETGWYNFGKRYLNPTTGLWLSADPALGEYLPNAPLTDDDKKHNQNLPGNGGIYNAVNFALYHFAGNNPIRYVDPDGKQDYAGAMRALQGSGGKGGWIGVGIGVVEALAALSHSSVRPAILDFAAATTKAQSSQRIFYRGLSKADLQEYTQSGMIMSKGARSLGILAARNDLSTKSLDNIGESHAWGNDFSPVLSLTTNPEFAAAAATNGADSSGMVAIIQTDRALPNPMGFESESEWLLPLATVPGEVVRIVPASTIRPEVLGD